MPKSITKPAMAPCSGDPGNNNSTTRPKGGKPGNQAQQPAQAQSSNQSSNQSKPAGKNYCKHHGENSSHTTSECRVLQTSKPVNNSNKPTKGGNSNGSGKPTNSDDSKPAIQSAVTSDSAEPETYFSNGHIGAIGAIPDPGEDRFQIDSGATVHIICSRKHFVTLEPSTRVFTAANGTPLQATGVGDVLIDVVSDKGQTIPVNVRGAYLVPGSVNLLSKKKFDDAGIKVLEEDFASYCAGIYWKDKFLAPILSTSYGYILQTTGRVAYAIQTGRTAEVCKVLHVPKSTTAEIWHQRMGHLAVDNLNKLRKSATGVAFSGSLDKCTDCIIANQKRKPREGKTAGTATSIGGLIHIDLCGPWHIQSKQGNLYWMPIIDDKSRFVWMEYILNKSDAPRIFAGFMKYMANRNTPVQSVRFDNGGEFDNKEFTAFLKSEGVLVAPSTSYSPESNGLAERTNGTIQNKLRAILRSAQLLPDFLWETLSKTAAYLHNRSPSRPLGGTTPYEAFYGEKPDLSHLRIIGSKAFTKVPAQRIKAGPRSKLADRSATGILVGYTDSKSIFEIYQPLSRALTRERDVVFSEPDITSSAEGSVPVEEDFISDDEVDDGVQATDTTKHRAAPYEIIIPRKSNRFLDKYKELPVNTISSPDEDDSDNAWVYALFMYTEAIDGSRTVTYGKAMSSPDRPKWQEAMQREVDALVSQKTWEVVVYTPTMRVLPGHWVLTRKPDRFKARWVVQGNHQKPGIDYTETYAPTALAGSIKIMSALAALNGWSTGQMDAMNAFLNAKLEGVNVYVQFPHGFSQPGKVCKLLKTLYGLCQSPREWHKAIASKLAELDFYPCEGDRSIFVRRSDGVIIIVYVDDFALFGKDDHVVNIAKAELAKSYPMRDLGTLNTFVGIQIERGTSYVMLHQTDYVSYILESHDAFIGGKSGVNTPFDSKLVIAIPGGYVCDSSARKNFQSILGKLNWLATQTRPDLANTVKLLAQFINNPPDAAINAMRHALRYLIRYPALGILYEHTDTPQLTGYVDASHGERSSKSSHSTTGYCFHLCGGLLSWASRKQKTVATSSTEAEYIAACSATKEAVYLRQFMSELGWTFPNATTVFADNTSSISMANNTYTTKRSRHIDFQYHYTREKVADGTVTFSFVPTAEMTADGLTKALPHEPHAAFVKALGLVPVEQYISSSHSPI
jgi:hypothetical protein